MTARKNLIFALFTGFGVGYQQLSVPEKIERINATV